MPCKAAPKISTGDGRGHPLPPVSTLAPREAGSHQWVPMAVMDPATGPGALQTNILMTTLKSTFSTTSSPPRSTQLDTWSLCSTYTDAVANGESRTGQNPPFRD